MKKIVIIGLSVFFLSLLSCSDHGTHGDSVHVFDSSGYTQAVAFEQSIIQQHQSLVMLLKTGRVSGTVIRYEDALSLLNKNIDKTSSSLAIVLPNALRELSKASGKIYDPFINTINEGGVYGGYLFDEYGLEQEQIIDKASFMGLFYHRATSLDITKESIHKYIALFGASPSFSNSDITLNAPDILSAAYAARRDKNDGKGLYQEFKHAVMEMQGHVLAGSSHMELSMSERKNMLRSWEKAIMATVINYAFAAHGKFTMTNPQAQDNAAGLHAVSENIGFILGMKGVSEKLISDTMIDELLVLLQWTNPVVFIKDPFTNAPALLQLIAKIQNVYGFTNEEVNDFKVNWVITQDRK